MVAVLDERFGTVFASDVHDFGVGKVGSFVGAGPDVIESPDETGHGRPDWIITNPPFALAAEFVEHALDIALVGVAMLVRTTWLEGVDRWERLFRDTPPAIVAAFVERVPMTVGRWDPDAYTATAYAWVVWRREVLIGDELRGCGRWDASGTRLIWIPPGCRQRLTRPDDISRFATVEPAGDDLFAAQIAGSSP